MRKTMKNILILALAMVFTTVGFAQNSKLNSAKSSFESGDYQAALEAINAAAEHKKTKDNPETWVYKAMIYSGARSMGLHEMLGLSIPEEAVNEALDKAVALDSSNKYGEQIAQASQFMIESAHNAGVQAYMNDKNYEQAVELFERKLALQQKYAPDSPVDTIANVVIGSSYYNLEQPEKAVPYYEKAIELGYDDQGIYNGVINYYKESGDDENYMKYLKIAQEMYPDVQTYKLYEIDYYLANGQADEKLEELKQAAVDNPDNINILLIISSIYEQKENYAEQAKWTEKAVAVDSENFAANFNAGVAYFNQAVKYNDELNFMDNNTSAEYKQAKATRDQFAAKAKPFFDKALQLKPDDNSVKQALIQYYKMEGQNDKAQELLNQMK